MSTLTYNRFQQLKTWVAAQGYKFAKAPHKVPGGFQATVTEEAPQVTITFYDTGTVLVQGADSDLKSDIEAWERQREDVTPDKPSAVLRASGPVVVNRTKLTEEQVQQIKIKYEMGVDYSELAHQYRVPEAIIRGVVSKGGS
jgi:ribonuclease HIII